MWMDNDTSCPKSWQTPYTSTITTNDGEVNWPDEHGYPSGANSPTWMAAVRGLLTNSGEAISSADCSADFAW